MFNPCYKRLLFFVCILQFTYSVNLGAQKIPVDDYCFIINDLEAPILKSFLSETISSSQFIMIGEQHGLKETSEFTNMLYNLSEPFGYNTLCIETDPVIAKQIETHTKSDNPIESARNTNKLFPFAIPFYNNAADYSLFKNISDNGGEIWGIDQPFMVQFRLSFSYLKEKATNEIFKDEISKLKDRADTCFNNAIKNHDFQAPFIFQYSDSIHNRLMEMSDQSHEKRILNQLKRTREIYSYNFTNQTYLNNLYRSQLMKENFLNYYQNKERKEAYPKIIFKLGANHACRGINNTNIYDISNLVSELAVINNMQSTHILFMGIKGEKAIANPFASKTKATYDNSSELPTELQEKIKNTDKKYVILQLSKLRTQAHLYSEKLQSWLFKYDIVVLVNNTKSTEAFH